MQTRTSFNGGEQSLDLATRPDVDAYMRGCRTLENWELSPMGGVRRRKGMRHFAALGEDEQNARLFPYIYTYAGTEGRYLIVVSELKVRVLNSSGNSVQVQNAEGEAVDAFESAECGDFRIDLSTVRVRQINSILMIVSAGDMPLKLQCTDEDTWTLERYEFKIPPWRYENELRDEALLVECSVSPDSASPVYTLDFSSVSDDVEKEIESADLLRLSYYTKQREAFAQMDTLIGNVQVRTASGIEATANGACIAVPDEMTIKYYVCKQDFPTNVYCEGLELPINYPDNFEEASDVSTFADVAVHWSMKEVIGSSSEVKKGTKFGIRMGYWRYYTCVKEFTDADKVDGVEDYSFYEDFFREGIEIGDALPCKGKWKFWCSGTWYGSYKVIRNYEQPGFNSGTWEDVGVSFSRNADAENNTLSGDEADEECYLRLVLTRSRRIATDELKSGFPSDSCGNRLVVESYRHDSMLQLSVVEDAETGEVVSHEWVCKDRILDSWYGVKQVYNWSWCAFSSRYGFPRLCDVFSQRLVFGSTNAQPQTLWLSRTDDIDNFDVVDADDSAICLTMQTTSQNPICWVMAQNYRVLLGTSEGEYILSSGSQGSALTPDNAMLQDNGHVGSERGLALGAVDRILYIERGAGRCYEYGYSYEVDNYRSSDLTVLAPHVLRDHGGATDCTLLRKPDTVAVFVCADGQLALCAYVPMQNVKAWHRWTTDGKVRAVCALPNGTASDRLFMVVERLVTQAGDDGDEDVKIAAIEVVDDDSGYEDTDGRDYTSTLVTNAMGNPMEIPISASPSRPVYYHFGEAVQVRSLEVSSDGENWSAWAKNDMELPRGWHKTPTKNKWKHEQFVGLRVHGANPCCLLAIHA